MTYPEPPTEPDPERDDTERQDDAEAPEDYGDDWRKSDPDMSLRPRPGESAADVIARVERAAKRSC